MYDRFLEQYSVGSDSPNAFRHQACECVRRVSDFCSRRERKRAILEINQLLQDDSCFCPESSVDLLTKADLYCFRGLVSHDMFDHANAYASYAEGIELLQSLLYFPEESSGVDSVAPRLHFAFLDRGVAYLYDAESTDGQLENAVQNFTESLEYNGSCDLAYCFRGMARNGLRRPREALEDLDSATSLLFLQQGVKEEQLTEEERETRNDRSLFYRYVRAQILLNLGRENVDEAIRDIFEVMERKPDHPGIFAWAAWALETRDQYRAESGPKTRFVEYLVQEYSKRLERLESRDSQVRPWGGLVFGDQLPRVIERMPQTAFHALRSHVNFVVNLIMKDLDFPSDHGPPLVAFVRQHVDAIVWLLLRPSPSSGMNELGMLMKEAELKALEESDRMKSFGQVLSLQKRLENRDSGIPKAGVVVVFHLISNCDLCKDQLCRWVLKDGDIDHCDMKPMRIADLEAALKELRTETQLSACRSLFDLLMSDLVLDDEQLVVIVPDQLLYLVPFGCLYDGERFFLERRPFSVCPSLSMIQITSRLADLPVERRSCALVCASAQLEHSQEELEQVINILGKNGPNSVVATCVALAKRQFSKIQFLECLDHAAPRFIHIACHSSSADPIREVPVPFDEFKLTGHLQCDGEDDLSAEDLGKEYGDGGLAGTELVFLNSCSLGGGNVRETGMLGFYRALFQAGCPSVICCLWPVGDLHGLFVATDFYCFLRESQVGMCYASALRAAILSMMRKPQMRSHPRLWGAWQLFGHNAASRLSKVTHSPCSRTESEI